jgi:hypothetical protein
MEGFNSGVKGLIYVMMTTMLQIMMTTMLQIIMMTAMLQIISHIIALTKPAVTGHPHARILSVCVFV